MGEQKKKEARAGPKNKLEKDRNAEWKKQQKERERQETENSAKTVVAVSQGNSALKRKRSEDLPETEKYSSPFGEAFMKACRQRRGSDPDVVQRPRFSIAEGIKLMRTLRQKD